MDKWGDFGVPEGTCFFQNVFRLFLRCLLRVSFRCNWLVELQVLVLSSMHQGCAESRSQVCPYPFVTKSERVLTFAPGLILPEGRGQA